MFLVEAGILLLAKVFWTELNWLIIFLSLILIAVFNWYLRLRKFKFFLTNFDLPVATVYYPGIIRGVVSTDCLKELARISVFDNRHIRYQITKHPYEWPIDDEAAALTRSLFARIIREDLPLHNELFVSFWSIIYRLSYNSTTSTQEVKEYRDNKP